MTKKEEGTPTKKDTETQYIKRPVLQETDIPNPIQGPVLNADPLFHFLQDVHDASTPKMWGIFLNKERHSVGNEILAIGDGANPKGFNTRSLVHYYGVFYAHRFAIITNHLSDDAAPSEGDKELISRLQQIATLLEAEFTDYIVVAGDHYWSMSGSNGTACHCGKQHYLPDV